MIAGWYSISADRPFLEALAAGVWRSLAGQPTEALAEATILVPTRRAVRALGEAFLKTAGSTAVLLPQVRALADLDENEPPFEAGDIALDLPPAISPWRRRFELAGLVVENQDLLARERDLDAGAALDLADALGLFLDGCQIEEVGDAEAVAGLVEGELARHWEVSAAFLALALDAWPARLEALGMMDVAARRAALLRRLAARWRERPPAGLTIAAGSTGAAPAAAELIAAIAAAPRGCVVLPGLDRDLADSAWMEVGDQHPQGGMKRLLARAGITRAQVREWDASPKDLRRGRWRRRLINEALAPPKATSDWLAQIEALRAEGRKAGVDAIAEGLSGLSLISARSEEDAASAVALLMREVLETPDKTCALITPDAALARRVSARLTRWNITADTSAGQPLAAAPAAVLLSLVARCAGDPMDPVRLLAIVKHPLTRLRMEAPALEQARRALERHGLRGPRPETWEALGARLGEKLARPPDPDRSADRAQTLGAAIDLLSSIRAAVAPAAAPFADGAASVAAAARATVEALESLAAGPAGGLGDLWGGQAGERLAELIAALIAGSGALPAVSPRGFSELLDNLMARELVRPGGASRPRLRILGVLEARLIRSDRLVLAGLEEGVWPQAAPIDPFLSRPMRERLGLPPPERRQGLSAHDFAQAAAAPEVVLVTTQRRAGAPAVESRWLWRLRTLCKGAGIEPPARPEILRWARALDAPLASPPDALRTAARPGPTPPVSVRPRKLAVTDIERWVRDPYALYARKILGLRPLDRPDEPVEARARGTAVHKAFERFALAWPDALPDEAESVFAALLLEELRKAGMPGARMAREAALAANVAPWVIEFERRRRPGARLIVETQGTLSFDAVGGEFVLTAKADRLEARDGAVDILDFKTGQAPSAKEVAAGLAPQLTLTGAIAAGGGFPDIGAAAVGELVYVQVSGGRSPGKEEVRGERGEATALAEAALAGLKRRIAFFDDPATPYLSWAIPKFADRFAGDYDHLARLWEWKVIGEGEGET